MRVEPPARALPDSGSATMKTIDAHLEPSKVAIIAAVCLAALILPLSFSGGAVATPAIGRDLGGSAVALNWITNAFMLSFGGLLMVAGALADEFGRKTVFVSGIAAIAALSLALSYAPSILVLDLLRAAQGVAAAAALSGGSAALAQEFEGHARMRAFSLLGTTFGVGLAFGPLIAGFIIETLGWRWVFVSSALVATFALCLAIPCMRDSRNPASTRFDWLGALAFAAMLSLFTFAVLQAPESGWGSPFVILLFAGAALSLLAFIKIERRAIRPMLDLSLFGHSRFLGVQLLPVSTCYCYVVLLVVLPLRFIGIYGYGEMGAGLVMIALSAPMLVVPVMAAVLTRRVSAGVLSAFGLMIAAAGLVLLGLGSGGAGARLVLPMALIGFGTAIPWGLMDALSVSVVPKERAGMAAGIFSTMRVAGEGIALAIVAATLAEFARAGLATAMRGHESGAPRAVAEAAQRLANGDLAGATLFLPGMDRQLLVGAYEDAFQRLTLALAVVTIVLALATLVLLRPGRSAAPSPEHGETKGSIPSEAESAVAIAAARLDAPAE
jgi:MFS family permease